MLRKIFRVLKHIWGHFTKKIITKSEHNQELIDSSMLAILNLLDTNTFQRSSVHTNPYTFYSIKNRVLHGNFKVAFLGGSISSGSIVTQPNKKFSSRLISKLKKIYPTTSFEEINAGQGSTGSYLGIFRLEKDVIKYKPDLVILEFSVNDGEALYEKTAYENIIRTLQSHNIAVIALFLCTNIGTTRQYWQQVLVKQYNIPAVSYYDAIFPLVQNNILKWDMVGADNIHPNDTGHEIIAELLFRFIEKGIKKSPLISLRKLSMPVPVLYGTDFVQTSIYQYDNPNGKIIYNSGFSKITQFRQNFFRGGGFSAEADHAELEIEFSGTSLGLAYRICSDTRFGQAVITIDDLPPVTLNGFDSKQTTTGFFKAALIQAGLPNHTHVAKIRIIKNTQQENTTAVFEIQAFLIGKGKTEVKNETAQKN